LQRKLLEYTDGGRRYKCAFVKRVVSIQNYKRREAYGWKYQHDTINNYWAYAVFTDEAHIDPGSHAIGDVLKERGTRYDADNIEEHPPHKGSKFYIAAAISYWGKSELQFYNDEEDYEVEPPYPSKPRRRPTIETQEEYELRVQEWEAGKPLRVDVKVQGNHMTQKYYVNKLLPIYVNFMYQMNREYPGPWLLQEGGDPSHGMKKEGLA
jgi:hypothetical protein